MGHKLSPCVFSGRIASYLYIGVTEQTPEDRGGGGAIKFRKQVHAVAFEQSNFETPLKHVIFIHQSMPNGPFIRYLNLNQKSGWMSCLVFLVARP